MDMDKPLQGESSIADDLIVGAEKIAEFLYGDGDRVRDVYRNVGGLTFFRHGAAVAALKSTLREEIREADRLAREKRAHLKATPKPRAPVRRRRFKSAERGATA
jgi:hypothetical protein